MTIYAKQSTVYPLIVAVLDTEGKYLTGLTVTYEVRRSSNNNLELSGTMIGVGDIYLVNITLADLDKYYVLYITPTGFENGEEELIVESATLTDIDSQLEVLLDKIIKILGLSQSNYRLTDQVYNEAGCLTSGLISIYANAADTAAENNPIAQYQVTAVYNVDLKLIDYQVVEI
jgi:hypothetical protein